MLSVALSRQYAIENRVAIDTITAAQGGVCAITRLYIFASESEGLENLSDALNNLQESPDSIVEMNRQSMETQRV